MSNNEVFDIYIDGASKNNPGPAGIGVIICRGEEVVKNVSRFLGEATNNIAEYSALICALEEAVSLGIKRVRINTDSQLVYRQIKREYKVKDRNIKVVFEKALMLLCRFDHFDIRHIPRAENEGADRLANIAVRKAIEKK